MYVINIAVMR